MSACRRKGPDLWSRSLRYLALFGWLLLVSAFFVLDYAKPKVETFFERVYDIRLHQQWDMDLAKYILWLMVLGLLLSVVGLVINAKRNRRRTDQWRLSLIFLGIISLAGIFLYFLNFS
ncbi:MAG: hypothetical protein BA870_09545 [Desulfuromonadales bacterium C00003094]|jgi:hypothetical protein|nr:MAG: hypothetical protein BA870_09545 [Desulfuromonadales bacterium C00003094]OEU73337.1 MAG: hypothetical protein BA869_01880 [Desulfuromonadales bacterium C00003107]